MHSSAVKLVRDAQVVFDEANIIPLFLAKGEAFRAVQAEVVTPRPKPVIFLQAWGLVIPMEAAVDDLKNIGFVASDLTAANYGIHEVVQAGYSATQLVEAGVTP